MKSMGHFWVTESMIGLRKVGVETTVYERAPELREVGAGISLWANAIRALDYLGVGQVVRSCSLPLERSELRSKEGRKVQISFSAGDLEKWIGVATVPEGVSSMQ